MKYVESKDKIQIAFEKSGKGKSLIIVGGSLADHQMYVPLASELSGKLTVINYDRRNRGKSGSSANHSIETELEDLETLMTLCETPPLVYGHSAGAALSIRAVAGSLKIDSLILSDLPFTPISENYEQEAKKFAEDRTKIVEFLNRNDKVGAVKFFLNDFAMNEQELNEFFSSENGEQAIANSITLPVDYDILGNGLTPIDQLKKVKVPTLIITSHDGMAAAKDMAKYITNCKLTVLPNPTYSLSPNEIAKPIYEFLEYK